MKYIRHALFRTEHQAQSALQDIQATAVSDEHEKVVLIFRRDITHTDMRESESDGRRGLIVGVISGTLAGLVCGLVLSGLNVLLLSFFQAAVFGLLLGGALGAIGAGLFGAGLTALSLQGLERHWKAGNVLATAETADARIVLQVEHIFKRHHAIMAGS